MDAKTLKKQLFNAKNNSNKPVYKRLFITGKGREFHLRLLPNYILNPEDNKPFHDVILHGGFKHPNFPNNKHETKFHCIYSRNPKTVCPLCEDYAKESSLEAMTNVPSGKRNAWKKEATKYATYWALDRKDNNKLTLVLIPNHKRKYKDKKTKKEIVTTTIQDYFFEKLIDITDMGINPFDLEQGCDVKIRSKVDTNKTIFSVSFDTTNLNKVDDQHLLEFKKMKPLQDVYEKKHPFDLQCVVKGLKIPYISNDEKTAKMKKGAVEDNENKNLSSDDDLNPNAQEQQEEHNIEENNLETNQKELKSPAQETEVLKNETISSDPVNEENDDLDNFFGDNDEI